MWLTFSAVGDGRLPLNRVIGKGVDQLPLDSLMRPGHLLDLRAKGVHEPITVADLEAAATRSGRPIALVTKR